MNGSTPFPQKLTKQQKRDLKRNAKKNSENIQLSKKPISVQTAVDPPMKRESVYKRPTVYPIRPEKNVEKMSAIKGRFITPNDKHAYNELLHTSYRGFELLEANKFPSNFHRFE
jgi:hypothetical protein